MQRTVVNERLHCNALHLTLVDEWIASANRCLIMIKTRARRRRVIAAAAH